MTYFTGSCQHGIFNLADGCPKCIAERAGLPLIKFDEPVVIGRAIPVGTAFVKVQPEQDAQVMAFYNEALGLMKFAESRVIQKVEDLKPATDDLSIIARLKKAMEAKRKDYLSPFQDHIKEVNETYKRLMEPIEQADKITRGKILDFQAEQARRQAEAEAINREKLELAKREEILRGEHTVDLTPVEVPIPVTRVQTDMGTVGQRMIRKYQVVDFAALPDQYKIENSALLNKVVKAGIPFIPGVEIWDDVILAVNTR